MATPEPGRRSRGRPNLDQLYDSLQPTEVVAAKSLTNSINQTFAWIPAGSFLMGSEAEQDGHRWNEAPVHEVVLTRPFYLGVQPVTQEQFRAVLRQTPAWHSAERGGASDWPVERVTWDEAAKFCELLSALPDEREAGRTYRLPTEAEWEYACRGGTRDGPSLADALYSAAKPAATGPRPPNSFGLYDMLGNIWEWCADWYAERYYVEAPLRDPAGPKGGTLRVCRGGSWKNLAGCCRPAYRNALAPHSRSSAVGFRVAVEVR